MDVSVMGVIYVREVGVFGEILCVYEGDYYILLYLIIVDYVY